jgi:hypothetical protein
MLSWTYYSEAPADPIWMENLLVKGIFHTLQRTVFCLNFFEESPYISSIFNMKACRRMQAFFVLGREPELERSGFTDPLQVVERTKAKAGRQITSRQEDDYNESMIPKRGHKTSDDAYK